MSGFNIQKILLSLYNPELLFKKLNNQENKPQLLTPEFNAQMQNGPQVQNQNQNSAMLLQNLQNQAQANLNDIQTQVQQQTPGAQNNQQPVQNQAQPQQQGAQNNQPVIQNQAQPQQQVTQNNQAVVQNQVQQQPQVAQNNQPVVQNQVQSQPQVAQNNQPVVQNQVQPQPQVAQNNQQVIQNQVQPQPQVAQNNQTVVQNQVQSQPQVAQNNQQVIQNQVQPQPQAAQNNQPVVQNQVQQQPQVAQNNRPVIQNQVQPQPQTAQNNQPVVQNQVQPQPQVAQNNRPIIQSQVQPQVNQQPVIQNTPNQNMQNTISEFNLLQSQAQNQSLNNQPTLQASRNTDNLIQNLQNSNIQNTDRSVYIKSLLNLPQNLADILLQLQNPQKPINKSTLSLGLINHELMQNKKVIESLFNENKQIQPIIEQINALNNMQVQNAKVQRDAVALFFSGMVSMPDVSKLILQNSKHAIASLIIAMAAASRQGGKNEQLQKTLNIINSCIAMAETDNPAQTLKSLMLLYLPWLPLNDGVGFDLEITPESGENESNNSKLTVLIQTRNYGNIKGDFVLTTSNSVDILITCSEIFPKKELERNLKSESNAHAMNTNIDIEEVVPLQEELKDTRETKVNLSATNEMNPYLLLMAHSFIRNTILIDNNALL